MSDLTITQFIFYTYFKIKSSLNHKISKSLHYVLIRDTAGLVRTSSGVTFRSFLADGGQRFFLRICKQMRRKKPKSSQGFGVD